MIQKKGLILWNKDIGSSYYKLGISIDKEFLNAKPGQFVMLHIKEQLTPLLRRPFSIFKIIDNDIKGIEILYKVVGVFTKNLSKQKKEDFIDVIGPLGSSFYIKDNFKNIFIAAGGIGAAPLVFLAQSLTEKFKINFNLDVFLGAKSDKDLLCKDEFELLNLNINISTDDGSLGNKGFVTDIIEKVLQQKKTDIIYACGPMNMLKNIAKIAQHNNILCQVSIETVMACGIGACLGCALESNDNNKYLHACTDGPVFDHNILKL